MISIANNNHSLSGSQVIYEFVLAVNGTKKKPLKKFQGLFLKNLLVKIRSHNYSGPPSHQSGVV